MIWQSCTPTPSLSLFVDYWDLCSIIGRLSLSTTACYNSQPSRHALDCAIRLLLTKPAQRLRITSPVVVRVGYPSETSLVLSKGTLWSWKPRYQSILSSTPLTPLHSLYMLSTGHQIPVSSLLVSGMCSYGVSRGVGYVRLTQG